MISEEPDEDADTLDDDAAMEAFLGEAPSKPEGSAGVAELIDWPPRLVRDLGLNLDADTLAWFQQTHPDWRRQMRAVLRSWMNAHTAVPERSSLAARVDGQP